MSLQNLAQRRLRSVLVNGAEKYEASQPRVINAYVMLATRKQYISNRLSSRSYKMYQSKSTTFSITVVASIMKYRFSYTFYLLRWE